MDRRQSRERAASRGEDGCRRALRARATVEGEPTIGGGHQSIADYRPILTNKSGQGAQEGVQPQGKELSTQGASLPTASLGYDFGRGEVGECGITIKERWV